MAGRLGLFISYTEGALPYGKIKQQGQWLFIYGSYGDKTIFRINMRKNKRGKYHMSKYNVKENKWETHMFLYSLYFGIFAGMIYDIAREKGIDINKENFKTYMHGFGIYEVLTCVSKIPDGEI